MVNEEGDKRWQRGIRSIEAGIAHIKKTNEFADVQFTVGGRKFKAHRLILGARSPQFQKMLLKKDEEVPFMSNFDILDVSEDAFQILLDYIYTDEIGKMDREVLLEVHKAATKYGQRGLLKVCEDLIAQWEITSENVIQLLNQMYDIKSMKDRCMQFLKNNTVSVLTSDGILPASSDTISLMFEAGYFKHVSVLVLLANIVRWAENQYPPQDDYKIVRQHLLEPTNILNKIGFEKLATAELRSVLKRYKGLLTPEEFQEIFMYTDDSDNDASPPLIGARRKFN